MGLRINDPDKAVYLRRAIAEIDAQSSPPSAHGK
jgi:hypothetical protein